MDDRELVRQFENCRLPFSQWSQRTDVKVAFLYLGEHPFDEALSRMRTVIQAYNGANNVSDEGRLEGYNETTTHAFRRLIDVTMRAYGEIFPTPGRTIHRYQIEKELAQGKTGTVFLAKDTKNDRPLALKDLWPWISRDKTEMQRFVRTMKTMHPIEHPSIISVDNVRVSDSLCWVAMERCQPGRRPRSDCQHRGPATCGQPCCT